MGTPVRSGAVLPAFYISNDPEWRVHVERALSGSGFRTSDDLKLVWNADAINSARGTEFSDGWMLDRLWVGGHRAAFCCLPRRIYFDSSGQIDRRPERMIFGGWRPTTPLEGRAVALLQLSEWLDKNLTGLGHEAIEATDLEVELGERCLRCVRDHRRPASVQLSAVHAELGYDEVPQGAQVLVVPVRPQLEGVAAHYAEAVGGLIGDGARVRIVPMERIIRRLDSIQSSPGEQRLPFVLVLVLGGRQEEIHVDIIHAMAELDRHRIPWRRAHADDDRQWSVRDQIGSLVQGLGGRAYRVFDDVLGHLPWSLGLDLSHRGHKDLSVLCGALINPQGGLARAWVHRHGRNEQISKVALRRIMREAASLVRECDPGQGLLVVRDGRLFEREDQQFYRERLGVPVTLLELRKRRNPPVLINGDLPDSPLSASLPDMPRGDHLTFLVTLPRKHRGSFDSVLKMYWREEWDGLGLGGSLPRILMAQSLAPGLGLHPHYLPAPLYWADGIAGASDGDLRFRGQAVVDLSGN